MASKILNKLERKFGRYAIPKLPVILVLGQLFFYLAIVGNTTLASMMVFQPSLVMEGQWWRVITFLFVPPDAHPVFIFFALYLLWLFGTALEQEWGAFRFNIYILIAYIASIGSAFIDPTGIGTNLYLNSSIMLAFAFLFPNFELLLFFFWPVKIKWLGIIIWVLYLMQFIGGNLIDRVLIIAAVSNFLLFFGKDLLKLGKRSAKKLVVQPQDSETKPGDPFHQCVMCGATDMSHPDREFRYAPDCICMECLNQQRSSPDQPTENETQT